MTEKIGLTFIVVAVIITLHINDLIPSGFNTVVMWVGFSSTAFGAWLIGIRMGSTQ